MMFENINSWLELLKASLKDLTCIINEDFYLDEYVKNMKSDIVNPELLIDIKEKIKALKLRNYFGRNIAIY